MMFLNRRALLSIFYGSIFSWGLAQSATGASGQSAGLLLLDPGSARAAALAEAFSSVADDISAFVYNPASLRSLQSDQASFMFQRGFIDDSRGRFLYGRPIDCGAIGVNINMYDGGEMALNDGVPRGDVKAKSDWVLSVGAARSIQKVDFGITGKFITSEIAEREEASAWALDVGAQMALSPRIRMGLSMQNIGTKLRYQSQREELPRVSRAGVSWQALSGRAPAQLFFEVPYYMNEEVLRASVGVETLLGPLAFRAGYQDQNDLANFSFGMGFALNKFALDYSYGLVEDVTDQHNVSFTMKFGPGSGS